MITSPCPCWTSASLAAAFFWTVFLLVLRLVSVCFACRWLCSYLACRWHCSSACCWLCSSRFFSSSLQIFVFFSLSLYPCCFPHSSRHLLIGCGSVGDSLSPVALRLWFLLCFFFRVTLWYSVAPFVIDFSVGALDPRESSLQQRVLLYVRYGLRGSLYLLLVGVQQYHCVIP